MKKRSLILALLACAGFISLHAQTIELPTKKKKAVQETTTTAPKQEAKSKKKKKDEKASQQAEPVVTTPVGTMTLPTTKRTEPARPVGEQPVAKADTLKPEGGRTITLPVVRRQEAPRAKPIVPKPKVEDNTIYESAEHMPTYPGGAAELMKFITEHMQYPQEALADSAQGIVQVSFIVEKDGSTTDFEVLDEHNPFLEAEAVRVLQQMPKWKPATHNGVKVRVEYVVPVKFAITN